MTATAPTTAQPATPGLDLDAIDASLEQVAANVDSAGPAFNPWALQALYAAETLVAEVRRLRELADYQEHHLGASHTNPPAAPCCTQRAGYDCDVHPAPPEAEVPESVRRDIAGPLSSVPPAGTEAR